MSERLAPENLPSTTLAAPDRAAAARMLARAFYKELRSGGYAPTQLIAVSAELIELITDDLRARVTT